VSSGRCSCSSRSLSRRPAQLRSFSPTGCHERCLPIHHNGAPRLLCHCEAKLRPQIEVFVVIERRKDRFESEAIRGAEAAANNATALGTMIAVLIDFTGRFPEGMQSIPATWQRSRLVSAQHIEIYPNRQELYRDETGRFWSDGTDRQSLPIARRWRATRHLFPASLQLTLFGARALCHSPLGWACCRVARQRAVMTARSSLNQAHWK